MSYAALGAEFTASAKAEASAQVDCGKLPSACATRVCDQARRSQFSTSKSDMRDYVEAGATCGAEAVCNAYIPGSGYVCGKVADAIVPVVLDVSEKIVGAVRFRRSRQQEQKKRVKRRLEAIADIFATYREGLDQVGVAQWEANLAMHQAASDALAVYNQQSPVHNLTKQDLLLVMQRMGLRMVPRWQQLVGASTGVRKPGVASELKGTGTIRSKADAETVTRQFGGMLAPDFQRALHDIVRGWFGEVDQRPDEALQALQAKRGLFVSYYLAVMDDLASWLRRLETASAMLMAYVAETAAKHRATVAARKAAEQIAQDRAKAAELQRLGKTLQTCEGHVRRAVRQKLVLSAVAVALGGIGVAYAWRQR